MDTRDKILEVARDTFVNHGYENTSISKVAKLAGLSTGAIYGIFKNKADILESLTSEIFPQVTEMLTLQEKFYTPEEGLSTDEYYHMFEQYINERVLKLTRYGYKHRTASLLLLSKGAQMTNNNIKRQLISNNARMNEAFYNILVGSPDALDEIVLSTMSEVFVTKLIQGFEYHQEEKTFREFKNDLMEFYMFSFKSLCNNKKGC